MSEAVTRDFEAICSALSDAGAQYHWEADNRGGKRPSRYIFVRLPVAMKIRVSNHASSRTFKESKRSRIPIFDVGPHATALECALKNIRAALAPHTKEG